MELCNMFKMFLICAAMLVASTAAALSAVGINNRMGKPQHLTRLYDVLQPQSARSWVCAQYLVPTRRPLPLDLNLTIADIQASPDYYISK